MTDQNKATPEEIERARTNYDGDGIRIDEVAAASRSYTGVWIAAWVWLGAADDIPWPNAEELKNLRSAFEKTVHERKDT